MTDAATRSRATLVIAPGEPLPDEHFTAAVAIMRAASDLSVAAAGVVGRIHGADPARAAAAARDTASQAVDIAAVALDLWRKLNALSAASARHPPR